MVDSLVIQYQIIFDEMLEEKQQAGTTDAVQPNMNCTGQKYLEHQLSWFGKKYCIDDDMTFADKEKSKKELIAFLESYAEAERQIGKDAQKDFSARFTKLYDIAFGRADPNLGRNYGIRKINGLLADQRIDYEIVNQKSYWLVRKCVEDQE